MTASIETLSFQTQDPDVQPHVGYRPSTQVDAARQLVARRYLDSGYVTEQDIDKNGHLSKDVDPYVSYSDYFWQVDSSGSVIATLRVIHPSRFINGEKLPIESSFELHEEQRQIIEAVRQQDPASLFEISALAKEKGVDTFATIDMYKTIWQFAKRKNIAICAISADHRLHGLLKEMFGSSIVEAGEPATMMGSLTVPSMLYPDRCASAMVEIYQHKLEESGEDAARDCYNLMEYLREGLPSEFFSQEERSVLSTIGMKV